MKDKDLSVFGVQWRTLGVFLLLFSLLRAFAGDSFPPKWQVGETWVVNGERWVPSQRKVGGADTEMENITKTFIVEGKATTNGINAFVVKILVNSNSISFYRAQFEETTKTLLDVKFVRLAQGHEQVIKSVPNDLKPNDTYSNPRLWENSLYLFDVPKFPSPNSLDIRTIYERAGRTLSQEIAFSDDRTEANVVLELKRPDSTLVTVTEQRWVYNRPWYVSAVQYFKSSSGWRRTNIVEVLAP
jgi:hypothetical protein